MGHCQEINSTSGEFVQVLHVPPQNFINSIGELKIIQKQPFFCNKLISLNNKKMVNLFLSSKCETTANRLNRDY